MATSTADHLFVAGHFPVYSVCRHANNKFLVEHLQPLLRKYNAHYITGHDHCQEYINDGKGVGHFISGVGDMCCYKAKHKEHLPKGFELKFLRSKANKGDTNGGFAAFYVTP